MRNIATTCAIVLATSGCTTQPERIAFEQDSDGNIVELAEPKESEAAVSPLWLGIAALAVGAVALSSGGDSGGNQKEECFVIVRGGSSDRVCR